MYTFMCIYMFSTKLKIILKIKNLYININILKNYYGFLGKVQENFKIFYLIQSRYILDY